jgi:hypothetical protein
MANASKQDFQDVSEIFRDSMNRVVTEVIRALEPQLNAIAHDLTNQAIDRSRTFFQSAYRESRRHPMYLFGFATALLVGAVIYNGMSGSNESISGRAERRKSDDEQQKKATVH